MLLARFAVFGTNKADILAFCVQILIAVQQIADVELVFRLVVFQTKDLARFVAVGAEIAVRAGEATLILTPSGRDLCNEAKAASQVWQEGVLQYALPS